MLPYFFTSSKDRRYLILEGAEAGGKVSNSKSMQDLLLLEFLQDHLAVCLGWVSRRLSCWHRSILDSGVLGQDPCAARACGDHMDHAHIPTEPGTTFTSSRTASRDKQKQALHSPVVWDIWVLDLNGSQAPDAYLSLCR